MKNTTISGTALSSDGRKILFSSDESGVFNAYEMDLETGKVSKLTDSQDSVYIKGYLPDGSGFLFEKDNGGNEISHIYLKDADGNERDLTPGEKVKAMFHSWDDDSKGFYFLSNKRDSRYFDVYYMDLKNFKAELIFENSEGFNPGPISSDGRFIALSRAITMNNFEMYIKDLKTDELLHITPHKGEVFYAPVCFSKDSRALYFITDEDREFRYLKKYILSTGTSETVKSFAWDVLFAKLSKNNKFLAVTINNDARIELKLYDLERDMEINLPELPKGEITDFDFSKDEKFLAFVADASNSPKNLFFLNFQTGEFKKLTDSLNPEITPEDLVEAEVVRFKSFDGLEIPGILYKPKGIEKGERVPALVYVHGGPGGQTMLGYRPLFQYLVNHGYAIFAVNNRGSSGYGKSFFKAADHKHGELDLADCVEARRFFETLDFIDKAKIGIIGGSYGGYMVLAALAFKPEVFEVGIDIFGVSNWVRTLKGIPPWWGAMRDALYKKIGDPYKEEEYLISISPLFHAERIVKPLLVLQGANDPRVLKVESDEIVEKVRKNGVPVEYVIFEDEGHGFTKKANQLKAYKTILEFLDKYLAS
ncbi:peptidase S9 [Kosmotoga pacifica]|uniref:Acyl-peptide hydrolase n=2 Tax=Kosmotoga pacifica TaxID=1330330 RepID=A0A0G2Z9N6_9BACT|nr:peptidase S9 [Kosmotoga pacifica]